MLRRRGSAEVKASEHQDRLDLAQTARAKSAGQSQPPGLPQVQDLPDPGGRGKRSALGPRQGVKGSGGDNRPKAVNRAVAAEHMTAASRR
jgi:hypothetical protein